MRNSKLIRLQRIKNSLGWNHKPCKDFKITCAGCRRTLLLDLLEDEIDLIKWSQKRKQNDAQG